MERTNSKRGLLVETTSYEQDLSSHSNPAASSSVHSSLHAASSTPGDDIVASQKQPQQQHPLATTPQKQHPNNVSSEGSLVQSRQYGEDPVGGFSSTSGSAQLAQHHINLSDADALLRRAHEIGLLDNTANSNTFQSLPQLQRLLAASDQLQVNSASQQQPQQPQTLPVQHFSPNQENPTKINHQYNLSTITERTSSNDSQSDAYDSQKLSAEPQRFNRDSNRPSTGSAMNGIGTGYSGVTSLSGPSPVQQVIGALQPPESIMQQHEQQRRRVEDIVYKYKMSLKKYQIYS